MESDEEWRATTSDLDVKIFLRGEATQSRNAIETVLEEAVANSQTVKVKTRER